MADRQQTVGHGISVCLCGEDWLWIHYRRDAKDARSLSNGRQSSQEYEPAFHVAQVHLGLGDHEQALASLEKACDERSVWLIWLGVDPKFEALRSNPRFQKLQKQIGFSQ